LQNAPSQFEERRQSLIGEIETAQAARREANDHLSAGETAQADADKAARAALEAFGEARTEAARAEERLEAAGRRTADIAHEIREMLETEPHEVAALAEIQHGDTLPDVAEI
jgi:chromosome segregation protein